MMPFRTTTLITISTSITAGYVTHQFNLNVVTDPFGSHSIEQPPLVINYLTNFYSNYIVHGARLSVEIQMNEDESGSFCMYPTTDSSLPVDIDDAMAQKYAKWKNITRFVSTRNNVITNYISVKKLQGQVLGGSVNYIGSATSSPSLVRYFNLAFQANDLSISTTAYYRCTMTQYTQLIRPRAMTQTTQ